MCAISEKGERPEVPSEAGGPLPGGTFPGFPAYCRLMQRCWAEEPAGRPSVEAIIADLRTLVADSSAHARRASGERVPKPPLMVPRLNVPGAGSSEVPCWRMLRLSCEGLLAGCARSHCASCVRMLGAAPRNQYTNTIVGARLHKMLCESFMCKRGGNVSAGHMQPQCRA